jgi:magnesium chelatase family protein
MPGEVSLAHRGVLFLDELPEFGRRTLESLREVLEGHSVRIARAGFSCVFPARFQLIAAANPCPCGWYQSGVRDCRCDDATIARYRQRVSGPLLDRIDLHVSVPAQAWRVLERPGTDPGSAVVRERVVRARTLQQRRGVRANAEIPDAQLEHYVKPTPEANALLGRAVDGFRLSARAARRVLRTARTIADLAEERQVDASAIAEALTTRTEASNPMTS